ncbi:MAG TPA: response regulator [Gemmatimonadales bacterium]
MAIRWLRSLSIEWKFPLLVCGVLVVTIAVLSGGAYFQVRKSIEYAADGRIHAVTNQMVDLLKTQVHQAERQVEAVGALPDVRDALNHPATGPGQLAAFAHDKLARDSTLLAVELWDSSGRRIAMAGRAASATARLTSEDLLAAVVNRDSGTVGRFQAIGDTVVVPAIAPVRDSGRRIGYVVLWQRISSRPRARDQIRRLIGSDGVLYIGSVPGAWTDQAAMAAPPPVDLTRRSGTMHYVRDGAGPRLAEATNVPGTSWWVLVEFPMATVLAPAHGFLASFIAVSLAVLLFGLVLAWRFSRRLTLPLAELTRAVDAIGSEAASPVAIRAHDELGRLATAFGRMRNRIDEEVQRRTLSEEEWRLLFEDNPHPMWVHDRDTLALLRVNEAMVRQYGYSRDEFTGMTLLALRAPAAIAMPGMAATDVDTDEVTLLQHCSKDGALIVMEARGRPVAIPGRQARLVAATDVTARLAAESTRTALEDQLRQSQKMEAIGRLAGGIAHDFNNLLTVISAYSELLVQAPLDHDQHRYAAEIGDAATRASALTRQLLTFSRKQVVQHQVLDAGRIITGLQPMLSRLLFENIELETRVPAMPALITADTSQVEQIIVNLAVNASDAMPDGGALSIEVVAVELDAAYQQSHGDVAAGRYIMLAVSDAGIGMDQATREKIFEPFFTTKAVGRGTGLGLATVYGIVKELGGHIWVYSELGHGTTFKVYLPEATANAAPVAATQAAVPVAASGGETVLLVEDDDAVRRATRKMLERTGYSVLEAADGKAGLAVAAQHRQRIDLVVTDLMMPGMDGHAFAQALQADYPDLQVIFTSGYTDDAVVRRGLIDSSQTFLQKPFTIRDITGVIRSVLDRGTGEQRVMH